ncbi:MAG: hypothetical protein LKG27_03940 [Clostridiaceae bacterium]|jgi:hypothetical protein|nr:hypothetical protein [Clostridiaceae bacterium]
MRKHNAFTMFEIGLVFVILTVLVGVSIRIAKAKYDSINSYLYYAAYKLLSNSVGQVYLDENSESGKRLYEKANSPSVYDFYIYTPYNDNTASSVHQLYKLCKPLAYFINSSSSLHCDTSRGTMRTMLANGDFSEGSKDDESTSFKPDFIASNGMRFFNTNFQLYENQVPQTLPFSIVNNDGTTKQAYGLTIYIDIDGNRNDSVLWQDVFPFYVTSYGYVVPAWTDSECTDNCQNPTSDAPSGGKSTELLKVSIFNNATNSYISDQKGLTFQQGVCRAGIITGDYCEAITQIDACKKADNKDVDCVIRAIVPIRL